MANLDISSRLGKETQTITIAEGLSYEVDCSAETMLKAEEKFKNIGDNLDNVYEIIGMFLGKKAISDIKKLNPRISHLKTIILATMAQANEISFEEMEKRFPNQI